MTPNFLSIDSGRWRQETEAKKHGKKRKTASPLIERTPSGIGSPPVPRALVNDFDMEHEHNSKKKEKQHR